MNNFITNIQKKSSYKVILITALFALISIALGSISYFVVYIGYELVSIFELDLTSYTLLSLFEFPLLIIPPILFVGYLIERRKNLKVTGIFSVVAGIIALSDIWGVIYNLTQILIFHSPFNIRNVAFFMRSITIAVLMILFMVFVRIATKNNTNKYVSAITMLIAIVVEILYFLLYLIPNFEIFIDREMYLYVFTNSISTLGNIVFYISLMLFGLKYTVSKKIQPQPVNVSPEYSLTLLNEKLNCGLITEEEYKIQRAEIISKL